MHDAGLVRGVHRPRQRDHQFRRLASRLGCAGQPVGEAAPLQQFQRDKGEAGGRADVIDLHDIGVMQPRDRFRLEPETVQVLRPGLEVGPDHLQGDQTLQLLLPGLVDHPHATVAQLRQDVVAGDLGPIGLANFLLECLREKFFRRRGFPPDLIGSSWRLLIIRRGGTRLVQDPIDQFDVSREPLAVLLRLGSLATVTSELQLQTQ